MGQVSISDCNGYTDNYTALHRVYTSQNINLTIALIPPLQMCFIQLNKQFLPLMCLLAPDRATNCCVRRTRKDTVLSRKEDFVRNHFSHYAAN